MNETIKNLLERRSVRGYKEDLVPEEVPLPLPRSSIAASAPEI